MGTATRARTKVHRRSMTVDGRRHTALTLRPGSPERFATNRFHETWHVLSDVAGARLLGRLCWAMAHERQEGTFVVIDRRFMVPNPFDADPSSPIVIRNSDLGPFGRTVPAALRRRRPWTARSDGTVVLRTGGLDDALADTDRFWKALRHESRGRPAHQDRRWIEGAEALVVLAAPPPVLREWAVGLSTLGQRFHEGSDYVELDWAPGRGYDGEVQIFEDFAARVSRAQVARARLFPGRSAQLLAEEERAAVWSAS